MNGAEDDGVPGKDVASRSLMTGQRRRYTDITDPFPRHEDAKYARSPRSGYDREKRMRNIIDREKQMIISSRDLHESFVEPLELVDDSDKDIRVRLGRSLKSVDTGIAGYVGSMAVNGSGQPGIGDRPIENTSSIRSGFALAANPSPFDLENLFKGRVKRQAASLPYDAYYDEMNQRGANPDSETMYYNRYIKNEENDHFQPYENRDKVSSLKDLELGKSSDADDYNRVSRNKDPAKKKKHNAKKKNNNNKNNNNNNNSNNKLKKKRKKVRKNKPKKMRRKRRHHKKQPKIKEHEKKRKKSMKNHRNIKKGKGMDQSEDDDKFHEQRKRHHGKGRKNVRI